jgi:hypothetical protein
VYGADMSEHMVGFVSLSLAVPSEFRQQQLTPVVPFLAGSSAIAHGYDAADQETLVCDFNWKQ